jgi:hypothetical protein
MRKAEREALRRSGWKLRKERTFLKRDHAIARL